MKVSARRSLLEGHCWKVTYSQRDQSGCCSGGPVESRTDPPVGETALHQVFQRPEANLSSGLEGVCCTGWVRGTLTHPVQQPLQQDLSLVLKAAGSSHCGAPCSSGQLLLEDGRSGLKQGGGRWFEHADVSTSAHLSLFSPL